MKKHPALLLILLSCFLFSCINEEGEGGTAIVQGYIQKVLHPDGEYAEGAVDTIAASEVRVYIRYGDEEPYSDDMRTGPDGFYKFKYLTKGKYTVFAYTEYQNGYKEAVYQTVNVGKKETKTVDDIYVHEGKMYGKYYIKGQLKAKYYKSSGALARDETPVIGERVYIRKVGIEQPFDDVRTGVDGVFMFEKLPKGKYEIYAVSEIASDRHTEIDEEGRIEIEITGGDEELIELERVLVIKKRA